MPRRPRLDPEIFHLPVERMREGYYSDKYFVRAREILLADGTIPTSPCRCSASAAYLGGIDEAIAILKLCSTTGRRSRSTRCTTARRSSRGRR